MKAESIHRICYDSLNIGNNIQENIKQLLVNWEIELKELYVIAAYRDRLKENLREMESRESLLIEKLEEERIWSRFSV